MRVYATGRLLALLLYVPIGFIAAYSLPAAAFSLVDVSAKAKALAGEAYKAPDDSALPKSLRELSYDQYRDIRFKPERGLWRNSNQPFEIQFFHPGFYFNHPVKINVVMPKGVRNVRLNPDDFTYGQNKIERDDLKNIGFAGFRIHYPINTPEYKDELAVFLGASYFRALGRHQFYGLSARGLAIDTAEGSGEEFPAFTEFWIEQPKKKATELVVYALLNSKRVTGAYRFTIRPGVETQMDVQSRLYFRDNSGKFGLAPLTSMFYFGENQPAVTEDYRPEVHDSDGLMVASGTGEWLWRPLVNPHRLLVTSFALQDLKGFGIMQRDRDFSHYQDLEARYDRRPSVWITPQGKWGAGRVELVQIPTPDETNDNIVAYWVPAQLPKADESLSLRYRISWQSDVLQLPPNAWVTQTLRGHGYWKQQDDSLRFIIDFDGPALRRLKNIASVNALIWIADTGELLEKQVYPNPVNGGWRVSLRMRRKSEDPVEMRVSMRDGSKQISETWSYVLPP